MAAVRIECQAAKQASAASAVAALIVKPSPMAGSAPAGALGGGSLVRRVLDAGGEAVGRVDAVVWPPEAVD